MWGSKEGPVVTGSWYSYSNCGCPANLIQESSQPFVTPVTGDPVHSCGLCVDLDLHGTRKYAEAHPHKDKLNLFKKVHSDFPNSDRTFADSVCHREFSYISAKLTVEGSIRRVRLFPRKNEGVLSRDTNKGSRHSIYPCYSPISHDYRLPQFESLSPLMTKDLSYHYPSQSLFTNTLPRQFLKFSTSEEHEWFA